MKLLTGKVDFAKINISHLGPSCLYNYIPEDAIYVVLVRHVISTNYRILVIIVRFRENNHLIYWGPSEEPAAFGDGISYSLGTG
jgi:hypothetical protein